MKIVLDTELIKVYEKKTDILKALAHPTRLFILDQLKLKTMCVCEINELINADVSTISKHLSILKKSGLVSRTKKGLQVFYTLETPCILNAITCVEDVIT